MVKVVILGAAQIGKTTLCQELLKEVGQGAGYWTEEVRDDPRHRRRTGQDIMPLGGSFLGAPLFRIMHENPYPHQAKAKVGRFTVMVEDFERVALEALGNSFIRKAKLVVIDELGSHCRHTPRFVARVRDLLQHWESEQREGHLLITVNARCAKHDEFCQEVLAMSDVEVIEVDISNWDQVYEDLLKRFKEKPDQTVTMSKTTKMAGMLSKMEAAIKDGQGENAKDIYQGDGEREERTKEEMQKNVLSIRGEDRRY